MTVVGNEIDRQDTIGGACCKESNTLRYGHHTMYQHACRENFLVRGRASRAGRARPRVEPQLVHERPGRTGRCPRHRRRDVRTRPARRLRAEKDVLVIVSNCPQMNNPCNDFNPTPLRMIIVEPETLR